MLLRFSNSQSGDSIYKNYDILRTCDFVFVCTAMNKTLEVLDKLEEILLPDTVVTDVCSLKGFVSKKSRPYKFVPSHPMAGTEHRDLRILLKGAFKGAKWVITPVFGGFKTC